MSGRDNDSRSRGRYVLPDALVVVIAAFFINMIYSGILYGGSGLLLQALLDALQEGKASTAFMFSLQNGVTLMCGMILILSSI